MKILTVIGARPQFVKAAALNRLIQKTEGFEEVLVHTGQHYDANMSDVFFEPLGMKPAQYALNISGGDHGNMTGRMMIELEPVVITEKPDWILIYGDTNSTLAAALVGAKLHIPIAHVEAGLRSFNRRMPEEVNRIVTDHTSNILFCPTQTAMDNLRHEGLSDKAVLVGDIMYDASLYAYEQAKKSSTIMQDFGLKEGGFILSTVHRAESTKDKDTLEEILTVLKQASNERPVILPLHPRTKNAIESYGLDLENIQVCEPVGPIDMAMLLANCHSVMTDSGGVQKEAYFFRKTCLTLRSETEWIETIEMGWNKLWKSHEDYKSRKEITDYGVGNTAKAILNALSEHR